MKYLMLIIMLLLLISGCSLSESQPTGVFFNLVLIDSFDLDILEPSDLCYDSTTNSLWTVSDNTNLVYNIDFEGNIFQTLTYNGEDLEGITYDSAGNTLWIVEELPVMQLIFLLPEKNLPGSICLFHRVLTVELKEFITLMRIISA